MDKNTYHRECLFRHPRFRQDLTAFYQRFPCVWRLWPRVKQHPPPDRFREGFHALITAKTDRVLILVPRTIEEVFLLHGATRWLLPAGSGAAGPTGALANRATGPAARARFGSRGPPGTPPQTADHQPTTRMARGGDSLSQGPGGAGHYSLLRNDHPG